MSLFYRSGAVARPRQGRCNTAYRTLPCHKEMGTSACRGIRPLQDGAWEAVFGTYGKLLFVPLQGEIEVTSPGMKSWLAMMK